jgi:hypothetical protein
MIPMPFVSPLPVTGPWTGLGMSRSAFLAILAGSTMLFAIAPTPVWSHLRDGHLGRLALSYTVIPLAVAVTLARQGHLGVGPLLRATLVLSLLKLVLTTALMMAIALSR